jgi:hypothetical protein
MTRKIANPQHRPQAVTALMLRLVIATILAIVLGLCSLAIDRMMDKKRSPVPREYPVKSANNSEETWSAPRSAFASLLCLRPAVPSTAFPNSCIYGSSSGIDLILPSVDHRVAVEIIDELHDALFELVF